MLQLSSDTARIIEQYELEWTACGCGYAQETQRKVDEHNTCPGKSDDAEAVMLC